MLETVRACPSPQPQLGGAVMPPRIGAELAERSAARVTRVPLEAATVASCNPGTGDADGDGRDEIAVPFNRGEEDVVALFRGDGTVLWETTQAPFYHSVYDDHERYARSHWHYRTPHRHLLTEIVDIDGDGAPEVVVGLGPIHVLDATTGELKRSIDLDGLAQIWTLARLSQGGPPAIVAGVNHHGEHGSLVAVDGQGSVLWEHDTVGLSFEDFMFAGDLSGDGIDEIAFSMADAERFEVRDRAGEPLWSKHVPTEVGEDTHVDDLVIAPLLGESRQVATSTGGCLFDAEGDLLWTLRERIEHGQKIDCATPPGREEPLIYLNSKTGGMAWGISPEGEMEWQYSNFSRGPNGILLTSAGDWVDWSAPGSREMVQAELLRGFGQDDLADEDTAFTLYLTVLDHAGREVAKIPYRDTFYPGFVGAMCARAARVTSAHPRDVVVITHNTRELLIISPAHDNDRPGT